MWTNAAASGGQGRLHSCLVRALAPPAVCIGHAICCRHDYFELDIGPETRWARVLDGSAGREGQGPTSCLLTACIAALRAAGNAGTHYTHDGLRALLPSGVIGLDGRGLALDVLGHLASLLLHRIGAVVVDSGRREVHMLDPSSCCKPSIWVVVDLQAAHTLASGLVSFAATRTEDCAYLATDGRVALVADALRMSKPGLCPAVRTVRVGADEAFPMTAPAGLDGAAPVGAGSAAHRVTTEVALLQANYAKSREDSHQAERVWRHAAILERAAFRELEGVLHPRDPVAATTSLAPSSLPAPVLLLLLCRLLECNTGAMPSAGELMAVPSTTYPLDRPMKSTFDEYVRQMLNNMKSDSGGLLSEEDYETRVAAIARVARAKQGSQANGAAALKALRSEHGGSLDTWITKYTLLPGTAGGKPVLTETYTGKAVDPDRPEVEQHRVVETSHAGRVYDDIVNLHIQGHICRDKMDASGKLKYGKSIPRDVYALFASLCLGCARKHQQKKAKAGAFPLLRHGPFTWVQTDVVDFASSPSCCSVALLNTVDHATKFGFLDPLTSKTKGEIVWARIRHCSIYGAPLVQQADNGGEFSSFCRTRSDLAAHPVAMAAGQVNTTQQLVKGSYEVHGKAYHSESNGAVERRNLTIENSLRAQVANPERTGNRFATQLFDGRRLAECSALGDWTHAV